MNGIHDMGGMHGFGPVEREENEPVFHEKWEGRVYGMTRQLRQFLVTDAGGFRYAIERIAPATYLASSYYGKWLLAVESLLIENGVVTTEELDSKTAFYEENPQAEVTRHVDPQRTAEVMSRILTRQPLHKEIGVKPRFKIGDVVRARSFNPPGHTRLPRYIRGKEGEIALYHGVHDFEDTVAAGTEAKPQPVYAVRFDAAEVWGDSAEANQRIYIDMWESYLEPVKEGT